MTHMRTVLTAVNLKRHIMKLKLQLLRLSDTCPAKCVWGRLSIIYLRGISSRRSKRRSGADLTSLSCACRGITFSVQNCFY